jgi:nickel/cobalt exporter
VRRLLVVAAFAVIGFAALPAGPAAAHPLGNFTVNRYAGLTLYPDRVDAVVVADVAELPTLQDPPASCAEATSALVVSIDGAGLSWAVSNSSFAYADGAGGLKTSRLECRLSAPARLARSAEVSVAYRFRDDRIGWRELVATGSGVRLVGSSLPTASLSDELRHYPNDLLASPPDVRSATFTVAPGAGAAPARAVSSASSGASPLGMTGPLAGAERWLEDAVGGRRLTPLVGLLAVLLALMLGAAHAALPGHGKTVMAAYLAGRRGRARDAVAVGATVTLTHTGGVLALGLLLTTVAGIAGEAVLGWLGFASGALVAAIGVGALVSAVRRGRRRAIARHHHHDHDQEQGHGGAPGHAHDHDHDHSHTPGHDHSHRSGYNDGHRPGHDHSHTPGHDHSHTPGHDHSHTPGHDHSHTPRHDDDHTPAPGRAHDHDHGQSGGHDHGPGKWGIAGLGIAGGLVPSPSALIVLLGAIALGRTAFGILLVIAYGLGMAATLTAAGLLLIRLRDRLEGRFRFAARWRTAAPPFTAGLIVLVGLGLAGRALSAIA